MRLRLLIIFFVVIGLAIGIILALQIRATPRGIGSSSFEQIEIQKELLKTFHIEQEDLKEKLTRLTARRLEIQDSIARQTSREVQEILQILKEKSGFVKIEGPGIRITLRDNPSVSRYDFSSINDDFVRSSHVRDLVNALFAKEARAISINGKRVGPLTPIRSVFDTLLLGNFQVTPPFVVEAVGSRAFLEEAVRSIKRGNISISTETALLNIPPAENIDPINHIALLQ